LVISCDFIEDEVLAKTADYKEFRPPLVPIYLDQCNESKMNLEKEEEKNEGNIEEEMEIQEVEIQEEEIQQNGNNKNIPLKIDLSKLNIKSLLASAISDPSICESKEGWGKNSWRSDLKCKNCREVGHQNSECKKPIKCFCCSSRDHSTEFCTNFPKEFVQEVFNSSLDVCFNCYQPGHLKNNCSFEQFPCDKCDVIGHNVYNCPKASAAFNDSVNLNSNAPDISDLSSLISLNNCTDHSVEQKLIHSQPPVNSTSSLNLHPTPLDKVMMMGVSLKSSIMPESELSSSFHLKPPHHPSSIPNESSKCLVSPPSISDHHCLVTKLSELQKDNSPSSFPKTSSTNAEQQQPQASSNVPVFSNESSKSSNVPVFSFSYSKSKTKNSHQNSPVPEFAWASQDYQSESDKKKVVIESPISPESFLRRNNEKSPIKPHEVEKDIPIISFSSLSIGNEAKTNPSKVSPIYSLEPSVRELVVKNIDNSIAVGKVAKFFSRYTPVEFCLRQSNGDLLVGIESSEAELYDIVRETNGAYFMGSDISVKIKS
jgi:hypothetical protein